MTKIKKLIYLLLLGLFFIPQAQAEWVDISPSVEISQTRQAMDRVNRQLYSYVTISNTSGVTIEAPLQLKIIGPNIPVVNADGLSADSYDYIQVNEDLLAGTEKKVRVSFELARKKLTFDVQLVKEGYLQTAPSGDYYNPPSQTRYISTNNTVDHIFKPYVDGGFIVFVVEGTQLNKVREIASSIGATIQGHFSDSEQYLFVVTKSGLTLQEMFDLKDRLFNYPEVELASINYLQQEQSVDSLLGLDSTEPPVEGEDQYYLQKAGITNAWTWLGEQGKSIGGTDKIIGVIDNMLPSSHDDLDINDLSSYCNSNSNTVVEQCVSRINLYQGETGVLNLTPGPNALEIESSVIYSLNKKRSNVSHGAHVTGIIAANHNDNGTSGVMKESQVLFMRGGIGAISEFDAQWSQMRMVNDYGVKVINMSWGRGAYEVMLSTQDQDLNVNKEQWCLYINQVSTNGNPIIYVDKQRSFKVTDIDVDKINFINRIGCTKSDAAFRYGDRELDLDTTNILNRNIEVLKLQYTRSERPETNLFYKNTMGLANKDVLLVAASGNEDQDGSMSGNPCSIKLADGALRSKVLCVGALAKPSEETPFPTKAGYSNYGKSVDIFTFGSAINSTYLSYYLPKLGLGEGDWVYKKRQENIIKYYKNATTEVNSTDIKFEIDNEFIWNNSRGTSMAAPIITGIAGLVWNAYPNLTASQVRESIIGGTAKSVDNIEDCSGIGAESERLSIEDPVYGHKIPVANAYCALEYAAKFHRNLFIDVFDSPELRAGNYTVTIKNADESIEIIKDITTLPVAPIFIPSGAYEITISRLGYDDVVLENCDVTLANESTTCSVILTDYSGEIQGSVIDAVSRSPITDATIEVLKNGEVFISHGTSGTGIYQFSAPVGSTLLRISAPGYITATVNVLVVEGETTTVTELQQVSEQFSGIGVVQGVIRSALNASPVSGVRLRVRAGVNVKTGTILKGAVTGASGEYELTLDAGNYTIETAKDGFSTSYFTVISIGERVTANQGASITPIISGGEMRIVLSWGEVPVDLDSHLNTPSGHHVYYGSQGQEFSLPYAQLDLDDTSSFGPETVTIYQLGSGTYTYSVHNFSGSPNITASSAKVEIFSSTGLEQTYHVPPEGIGRTWTVFSLDGDSGEITSINTIQ